MLVIGLTGGIGSGKSEVAHRFQAHGIEVIDTDIISRELVEPNKPALGQIINRFGNNILLKNGSLDRTQSKLFLKMKKRDTGSKRCFTH